MSNKKTTENSEDKKFPLPEYPDNEDIYKKEKEERFVEEDSAESVTPGSDLDVPGSELDDADEAVGEEDEENNYYSLGGEDHNDLEEDPS
jgi:hypothetical protein